MSVSAADLFQIEGHGLSADSSEYAARWTLESFESELSNAEGYLFYREDLKGFVLYRKILKDELEIMNVSVQDKGCGKGSRLLQSFLEHITQAASSKLRVLLEVRSSNKAAIRLYESNGFVQSGSRPRYYKNSEDALLMEKHL